MLHARKDYNGRIVDLEKKIPEDEPVFLLRGQDKLAPAAIACWATLALKEGADPVIIEAAMKQAEEMMKWQIKHGSKIPDMPREG
jgi:hypothetical protein